MRKIVSLSPEHTRIVGRLLGEKIEEPLPILLFGDLGTGKTVFVRGLTEGVGSPSRVKSPSFTILYIYNGGRFPVYHFDLYRLNEEGVGELLKEGYFEKDGIIVVEWGEKFPENYFTSYLKVEFSLISDMERELVFSSVGNGKLNRLIDEVICEYNRD